MCVYRCRERKFEKTLPPNCAPIYDHWCRRAGLYFFMSCGSGCHLKIWKADESINGKQMLCHMYSDHFYTVAFCVSEFLSSEVCHRERGRIWALPDASPDTSQRVLFKGSCLSPFLSELFNIKGIYCCGSVSGLEALKSHLLWVDSHPLVVLVTLSELALRMGEALSFSIYFSDLFVVLIRTHNSQFLAFPFWMFKLILFLLRTEKMIYVSVLIILAK